MELIIGLLSGAAGGDAAGNVLGSLNQGILIDSIAGVVGGGLGDTILSTIGVPDLAGAAGGGVGGDAVLALVEVARNMIGKQFLRLRTGWAPPLSPTWTHRLATYFP
jgi:uncharacterized membrane protein YeaQ/YmgE (transglycosylase-associated protein family)